MDVGQRMTKVKITTLCVHGLVAALSSGCEQSEKVPILGASAGPLVRGQADASAPVVAPTLTAEEDQALRRNYGAAEMRYHECATLQTDGKIRGKQCPSGFVVFGPYVAAPSNSNLHIQFDIQSPTKLTVSSDVVSDLGKQFHGALGEQTIEPNKKLTLGYTIHLPLPAEAVEARLFVQGESATTFDISNLVVGVQ
jgi:hypothetical protein